ncbi:hypothetical protein IFM89_014863 [Coptis chinensis]|uniref:Uncharacterized protein n=1 Tax=Coptis chinensis TaxID=261450 RepID=A0A835LZI3_9MAGN|nr:hypothetical protein IFM89_014863 [Coptis chinensis]
MIVKFSLCKKENGVLLIMLPMQFINVKQLFFPNWSYMVERCSSEAS